VFSNKNVVKVYITSKILLKTINIQFNYFIYILSNIFEEKLQLLRQFLYFIFLWPFWHIGVQSHSTNSFGHIIFGNILFSCTVVLEMGILCWVLPILYRNKIGELQLFSILLSIILFRFFFLCVCHSDHTFLGCLYYTISADLV